ncbi:RNA 2'-phosphotransferase [soil metagenome]
MSKELVKKSKFLSLILRHEPEKIGIALDENGWVEVDVLLAALGSHGRGMDRAGLEKVVAGNDKKRFAFSEDGRRIRANQGHSVEVDLALVPQVPPEKLFHGTVDKFLVAIYAEGLLKGERHHVHLSADLESAAKVGQRRGRPVILEIAASEMHRAGHQFFLSENGVWLTDMVPPKYLQRLP